MKHSVKEHYPRLLRLTTKYNVILLTVYHERNEMLDQSSLSSDTLEHRKILLLPSPQSREISGFRRLMTMVKQQTVKLDLQGLNQRCRRILFPKELLRTGLAKGEARDMGKNQNRMRK